MSGQIGNNGLANYGGRNASGNTSVSVKTFYEGNVGSLFKQVTTSSGPALQPISYSNMSLPNNLYYGGALINISDERIKQNIAPIDTKTTDKLMNLKPRLYTYKNDAKNHLHYGFIAQDVESEFPNLVHQKSDKTYGMLKTLNYLEMIPLLVDKIQMMQKEIDELKDKINSK